MKTHVVYALYEGEQHFMGEILSAHRSFKAAEKARRKQRDRFYLGIALANGRVKGEKYRPVCYW